MTRNSAPASVPTKVGSVLTLTAAVAAVGVLADDVNQLLPVAIEVICLATVVGGRTFLERERNLLGRVLVLAGFVGQLGALGAATTIPVRLDEQVVMVVGLFGVLTLLVGLYPLRRSWAKGLVNSGIVALVGAVIVAGTLREASIVQLAISLALSLVARDAGLRAVELGQRVGHDATTGAAEVVQAAGSVGIGCIAVLFTLVGEVVAVDSESPLVFALLLSLFLFISVSYVVME